ncbi:MAG: amidohydrolase [Bacteroidetes bacterium]|nr:amidohydrolase [Bacteroidota bacterium]
MSELRITTVQSPLAWADAEANKAAFAERLKTLKGQTDLILLPEMFTTGFFMEAAKQAEIYPGPTIDWMREQAVQTGAVVSGSLICEDRGSYYNRLIWMQPDGKYFTYDKRHLFAYGGEADHFSAGYERLSVQIRNWRICPLICYDLRFPVWSRNTDPYYDLLVYVANWPSARVSAWTKLLQARAIENQAYVAGVNRTGSDGNGIEYPGKSCLIDFQGNPLFEAGDTESIETSVLSLEKLKAYRSRYPFLESSDSFKVLRD